MSSGDRPKSWMEVRDDPCGKTAVEQFLYMDPSTGLHRVSKPQCGDHSAENQPAETMECLPLDAGWLCEGDEWQ